VNGRGRSFVRARNGRMTVFDAPSGPIGNTTVTAMNGLGFIVGNYHVNDDVTPHGFVRTPVGFVLQLQVPQSVTTLPWDINDGGTIAGFYANSVEETSTGFIRSPLGVYRSFSPPADCSFGEGLRVWLNDRGDVAGSCDRGFSSSGFIRTNGGAMIVIDFPGADATGLNGISANGDVAGSYRQESSEHCFTRSADGTFTSFDFPGAAPLNFVQAMDSRGNIVGISYDDAGKQRGFIRYAP